MNDFIRVTAAIIVENKKILITQRHKDDAMGGKWEFPGGKIEPGETPEVCLKRELQEELGILADVHELYAVSKHSYSWFNIELLTYRATIKTGPIQLNAHQAYRWIPVRELPQFDFPEADKPIIEKLMKNCKDFF